MFGTIILAICYSAGKTNDKRWPRKGKDVKYYSHHQEVVNDSSEVDVTNNLKENKSTN